VIVGACRPAWRLQHHTSRSADADEGYVASGLHKFSPANGRTERWEEIAIVGVLKSSTNNSTAITYVIPTGMGW
jgi:hypothetical protein